MMEERPFANEHACRLRDPGAFQEGSFKRMGRTSNGKRYDVIMGRLKGETALTEQAFRYPRKIWAVSEARKHCKEHDGKLFEPATEGSEMPEFGEVGLGDREVRFTAEHEIRFEQREDGVQRLSGYPAVFNRLSVPLFGFREIIRPGAFTKSLKNPDVRALWNHDTRLVLGRVKNQTLTLFEDEKGLGFSNIVPNTSWARDTVETIRRGDVDQMSFAFRVRKGGDRWTKPHGEDKDALRELLDVELFEVSPVTFPAYPQTTVSVRDFVQAMIAEETGYCGPDPGLLKKHLTLVELEV